MNTGIIIMLLPLIISFTGCIPYQKNNIITIDITGNWQDENGFPPFIQTFMLRASLALCASFIVILLLIQLMTIE